MEKPVRGVGTRRIVLDSGRVHEGHLTVVEGAAESFFTHTPSAPWKTREDRIDL
jgi:hypothetical protein